MASTGVDKIVVERDLSVTGNTTRNVDFASAGFAPESHAISLNNIDGTWTVNGSSSSSLITATGTRIVLGSSATAWLAFPAGQTRPDDLYLISISANKSGNWRRASRFVGTPADLSLDMPSADISNASASAVVTSPSPMIEFTWDADPSADVYILHFDGAAYLWDAYVSPGWLGAGPNYDYRQPDLSSVSGWDSAWDVTSPTTIAWNVNADSSSQGLSGSLIQLDLVSPSAGLDGLTRRSAFRGGAFTVP
jgi:hypothetical protein